MGRSWESRPQRRRQAMSSETSCGTTRWFFSCPSYFASPSHQLTCEGDDLCVLLRLDDELSRKETLRLVLCDVGSVDDVGDELRPEWKSEVVAVDVAGLLLVDDKEIVALLADGDIGVLAHLDVAFGAEDEESSVAPRTQAVGGEPVQPDVAHAAIAAQHPLAEVLEFGPLRMVHVGDLRLGNLGLRGAGVVDE